MIGAIFASSQAGNPPLLRYVDVASLSAFDQLYRLTRDGHRNRLFLARYGGLHIYYGPDCRRFRLFRLTWWWRLGPHRIATEKRTLVSATGLRVFLVAVVTHDE